MDWQTITYRQDGAVAVITADRPQVLNAQSRVMINEITTAFRHAGEDDSVRVVVVAGAGEHFSAGHDLGSEEEMADRREHGSPQNFVESYERATKLFLEATLVWRDLPKPTIAQVQGYCIMGGLMLATACDIIVAADDAKFADRSVRWGGSHVQYFSLPWEAGARKAKEYLFTGDWITADEALKIGLVNRVVSRDRLEEETLTLAQRIALQDPFALRLAKISVNQMLDEMGQRNAIIASFQTHMLSTASRAWREDDRDFRDRIRRRDEPFGDHREP
jgi:enoyl-CoA hydratase